MSGSRPLASNAAPSLQRGHRIGRDDPMGSATWRGSAHEKTPTMRLSAKRGHRSRLFAQQGHRSRNRYAHLEQVAGPEYERSGATSQAFYFFPLDEIPLRLDTLQQCFQRFIPAQHVGEPQVKPHLVVFRPLLYLSSAVWSIDPGFCGRSPGAVCRYPHRSARWGIVLMDIDNKFSRSAVFFRLRSTGNRLIHEPNVIIRSCQRLNQQFPA
jgi:hypothetical protein